MRIGDLGRRTGVGAHLLRYYEAQGLLEPARGDNGYREYADADVHVVRQIRALLEAGLSTDEIRVVLPCAVGTAPEFAPCSELLETLRGRMRVLDERAAALESSRRALRRYIDATAAG